MYFRREGDGQTDSLVNEMEVVYLKSLRIQDQIILILTADAKSCYDLIQIKYNQLGEVFYEDWHTQRNPPR